MSFAFILAADYRGIGLTVAAFVLVAFVGLFIRNVFLAKPELGSEMELAANRVPYLNDEELEGPKLDKSLSFALVLLGLVSISLPFYWLAEPGRQEGAVDAYQLNFESRGEGSYLTGAQCVNCHSAGGVGGVAPYVLQDADGQFIANASWTAPALNNLFNRYDEEEVTYILNYGRPGSPMAAWGTPGGGPLTTQQVQNIIEYIQTFQVQTLDPIEIAQTGSEEEVAAAQEAADELATEIQVELQRSVDAGEFDSVGEAVFNLGYFSGFKAGSLSCGRCHTAGWSLGSNAPHVEGANPLDDGVAACGGGDPSGIGYSLCGGVTDRFPDDAWKNPDGTWAPEGGHPSYSESDPDVVAFRYYLSMAGDEIELDQTGKPITGDVDADGADIAYSILRTEGVYGDLAYCTYISNLWEPGGVPADAYPFAEDYVVLVNDDGGFIDPPQLSIEELSGETIVFADGRLGGDCTFIDMPDRTSRAQFNFISQGATAGSGYGNGGQSHRGMMPGFAGTLPAEYIQAAIDYVRGL